MEYHLDEKWLKDLCKEYSGAMVGKLCKQNESLQSALNTLSPKEARILKEKLEIIKKFNRELVYESFRDLLNQIKCHQQGRVYEKYKIYKPTDK